MCTEHKGRRLQYALYLQPRLGSKWSMVSRGFTDVHRKPVQCTSMHGNILVWLSKNPSRSFASRTRKRFCVTVSVKHSGIDCILIPVAAASTVYIGVAAPCVLCTFNLSGMYSYRFLCTSFCTVTDALGVSTNKAQVAPFISKLLVTKHSTKLGF